MRWCAPSTSPISQWSVPPWDSCCTETRTRIATSRNRSDATRELERCAPWCGSRDSSAATTCPCSAGSWRSIGPFGNAERPGRSLGLPSVYNPRHGGRRVLMVGRRRLHAVSARCPEGPDDCHLPQSRGCAGLAVGILRTASSATRSTSGSAAAWSPAVRWLRWRRRSSRMFPSARPTTRTTACSSTADRAGRPRVPDPRLQDDRDGQDLRAPEAAVSRAPN